MAVVFAKTPKGYEEVASRSGRLTPRVRRLLIFVDGKRSLDELRGPMATKSCAASTTSGTNQS